MGITCKSCKSPVAGDEASVIGNGALIIVDDKGCVAGDFASISVVDNCYGERNKLQKAMEEDGYICDDI